MAIFAPFGIGRTALLAHERALGVTGHNIANVNTPGYSRQRVELTALSVRTGDGLGIGGVRVADVRRVLDPFLDARVQAVASEAAGSAAGHELLRRLELRFPIQGPGIGGALQEFFASANALAAAPQDLATRSDLLSRAGTLAARVRGGGLALQALQRELDDRVELAVGEANERLTAIANLNRQIIAVEAAGGEANDLRDRRQRALNDLAERLEIRTVAVEGGGLDVFDRHGVALVVGDAGELGTELDPASVALDGGRLRTVGFRTAGGALVPLGPNLGGTIGELLHLRDVSLPGHAAALDQFAVTLRDAVNAVQTDPAGRDLDGLLGAALFAGTGAADLDVALTNPRGVAAAQSANPGDNTNALALAALEGTAHVALGDVTFEGFFADFQARVGDEALRAEERLAVAQSIADSAAAQREAVSGVSLEEEFTNLIRFQRGFQAAAQLISVSNGLLDDLLGLVS